MTFDMDYIPSTPKNETEWMLQWGDAPHDFNKDHVYAVQDAIDKLSEQSKYCIEAIFYERLAYSELGQRLGVSKPHAWRLSKRAIAELQRLLLNDHSINMRYQMFDCWDDAAQAIVDDMDHFLPSGAALMDHLHFYQKKLAKHVREHEEIPIELFTDLGDAACSHLKNMGEWNAEAMGRLLVSKQHDYGHQNILMFGHTGIAIRMCDKIARLFTLTESEAEAQNESIVDSWRDLVGYAVIALMLWNDTFTLELRH